MAAPIIGVTTSPYHSPEAITRFSSLIDDLSPMSSATTSRTASPAPEASVPTQSRSNRTRCCHDSRAAISFAFMLAVRWHPDELVDKDPAARGLFQALVAAARRS